MAPSQVVCPHCRAAWKSAGPPGGPAVRCPHCGKPLTVPARGTGSAPPPLPAAPPRPQPPPLPASAPPAANTPGPAINLSRLLAVVAGGFLYLAVGASLTAYCVAVSRTPRLPRAAAEAAAAPARAEEPPPLVALPKEEQARINEAINRAVRFLKTSQGEDGTWKLDHHHAVGYAALPGLTLLEAGVPATDPAVQKAAGFVRDRLSTARGTYDLSLALLFLDRLGEARDKEWIRTLALRLMAGQNASGGWSYTCPFLAPEARDRLYDRLAERTRKYDAARPTLVTDRVQLPRSPEDIPALKDVTEWGEDAFDGWEGDNSNTQFALLGLWAARRHDIPLGSAMRLLVKRFRHTQQPDGSWHYGRTHPHVTRLPTMTCAGLLGLAVGHGIADDREPRPEKDPGIERALGVLAEHVGEPAKDARHLPMVNLYYLWSVERVAVLYQRKELGGRDWYAWGSQILLANQRGNGNWTGGDYPGSDAVIDTCFATLFLKQANLTRDLSNKLQHQAR